jgi:hypothetical protein
MRKFSYTLSQKKQKKIKISNTNRDPYLNHQTLIRSDYDNISGIRMIEYMKDIHVTNITNEFINYFNIFITNTGTQDLSNFFDIEIKNISTNLTKLLDNASYNFSSDNFSGNDLLTFFEKNIYEESFMKINEKYKNNYNFIVSSETPINIKIKNIQDETFNINKNYKSTLQSFILLDDNNKKYLINDLSIDINLKTKNPINFLYNEEYIEQKYDNNDLLKSITLNSIDINKNIIYKNIIHQENNIINDKNIFSFKIESELNNSFMLLDENDDINTFFSNNYNFIINPIKKNNLLEDYTIENDTIIDNHELSMNMININNLNFLNIKDNYETNKSKNIDEQIINFDKIMYYNFNKLFFINDADINNKNKNINDETKNIYDENKNIYDENKNIYNENKNINSEIIFSNTNKNLFLNNNLQYLNTNDIFLENLNYSNGGSTMNNFKINNKLSMIPINNENIKIKIKENNENILFSSIDTNMNLNINKFIPKETIDELNITNIPINLELNINTDVTKFNNFLNNKIINTNDVLKEKQKEFILNGLRKTSNCIINVYQLVYNENKIATGLGDFIRGSYFLIEFCKKYNFKYFIDISNHPIKNFLKKYNKIKLNEKIKNIYKKINKFEQDNFNPIIDNNSFINNYSNKEIYFNFLEYLSNEEKYNNNIFVYTITFPNEGIINNYKKIMRDIFEPTDKMELLINIKLKILDLKLYSYEIIHIRCGDEYLSDKKINNDLVNIEFVLSELDKLNPNKKYLLISDNNFIKTFIKKKYNFINILYHDIVHTGENREIILKKLENTMLDFYLISKSKNVVSYSVYKHGSGFSKWCAFTYDIPYYCKYFGK